MELAMEKVSLTDLAREHLATARSTSNGRSAHTAVGGHGHVLRQTVIAMVGGQELEEHNSPGEATLQVVHGRVRLVAGEVSCEGSSGDLLIIPPARHRLLALDDAVVLLTVAKTS